jgi:hypothetical protein
MLGSAVDPVTTATLPINRWRNPSIGSLLRRWRPWDRGAVTGVSGFKTVKATPVPTRLRTN